jgi:hypothetical protein
LNTTCKITYESFEANINLDIKTIFEISVSEWFRRGGDAKFLETHDLNQESVVVDVGGFTGVWAEKIIQKYDPKFFILEPVKSFQEVLDLKFSSNPKVKILRHGLGSPGEFQISLSGDASSIFDAPSKENAETIQVLSFDDFILKNEIKEIDLLQINIEGAEYDLFDQILKSKTLKSVRKIQVQFHLNVENALEKRNLIRSKLAETHRNVLNFPFVWETWELLS